MTEHDILITDFPYDIYNEIVSKQIEYSIISIPFTIDRMNQMERYGIQQGIKNRIENIFKGKIAEALFESFAAYNNLSTDFLSCTTPYYQVDKRDFLYKNIEFDIKNNFIYHIDADYNLYTHLPAMIPNRSNRDQWASRLNSHLGQSVSYLFSFMKGADLVNGQRGVSFLEINISQSQSDFLYKLWQEYKGEPQQNEPFKTEWFWNEMEKRGDLNFFELKSRPNLVLCGIADHQNWDSFKDVGPYSLNNYMNEPIINWYRKVGQKNSIKFLNGEIWGTITNRTIPIIHLKPFADVFKDFDVDNLVYARFKQ